MRSSLPSNRLLPAVALVAAVALSSCSSGPASGAASPTGSGATSSTAARSTTAAATTSAASTPTSAPIPVTAAFYPLEYLLTEIGGPHVTVTTLTKPGVEPHDLELTPQDVAGLSKAKLVVTLKGFQPAVDAATAQQAPTTTYDVAPAAALDLAAPEHDHEGGDTHGQEAKDPHFWLDPDRYTRVGYAVTERLVQIDPANAATYRQRADAFAASLTALDTSFTTGTTTCANRKLVTSHAAFGYLARKYSFTQVPIAGLSPEQEPTAKQLAAVATVVKDSKATTIYAETLVDPKFAQTVATSTGATIAVLDPIEGITTSSAGKDYREVMQANLTALRAGQGCQ
ncbi:MAG TPA: metal ABC transporter substrate-binding protein [Dermatophilaceae bacterium]|nr:metal ABC transporter substrate-binding protein [Dermatophilaceae bacterium]